MLPTAISQIIEAAVKSSVGIALAVWLMPYGIAYAAAGAIAGITFGELFGLLFLFLRSKMKDSITAQMFSAAPAPQRKRVIIAQIMRDSIPFTIAAAAMNINPFIDMLTIPTNTDQFTYGSYTGIALPIFTIATGVTAMLGKSAFPEITAAYENGDNRRMLRAVRILFKSALMAGLPVCIGLAALSQPLLSLLYFSRPQEVAVSAVPLSILGAGGIFLIISGMLFSIFMAAGRVDLQIKLMLTGSVVKLVLNLLLIPNENTGVSGAAISTIAAYAVVSIIGLILLKPTLRLTRENSEKIGIPRFIFQPLIFAILCGITAEICHNDIFADIDRPAALTLAMSVAAGAVVYLTLTMFSDRKYIKTLIHSIKTRKNPPLA
jgi:stage V sporulation protein B